MAVGWHRKTKIIIDTQAIKENVSNELKRLPAQSELFAVVKADGYGHGAIKVAKSAKEAGATGFCVAILDEAIELREAGIKDPILILGIVDVSYIEEVLKYDLAITVATKEWLLVAIDKLNQVHAQKPLKIHIKIDTGMGRIGFVGSQVVCEIIQLIKPVDSIDLEGIFTHFATADSQDNDYYTMQNQAFIDLLSELDVTPKYIHCANSASVLWHNQLCGNMVRFGIAMYGLNPSGGALTTEYSLKPALELHSELIQVKKITKNECVGYGVTYRAKSEEWVGTIPIGYADGWLRKLQGFFVLVKGKKCEIIGRICMDQCMIRLPEEIAVGEKVTLIGKNGEHEITMQMVADYLETIHYEVSCVLSSRIPREYR